MIEMQIESISPQLAAVYLERNKNNRNLRPSVVDAYAREMKDGNWSLSHQGIAFNENGDLVDGQHRLNAIIKAGITIQIPVTRGLTIDCVGGIDQGAKRQFQDVLRMQYADNSDVALRNSRLVSVIRGVVRFNVSHGINMTFHEVCYMYEAFKEEFDTVYSIVNKKGYGGWEVGTAIASAVIWGEPREAVERFGQVFVDSDISDCEDYNATAALNWQRQMTEAKIGGRPMTAARKFLGTENAIWNFCNDTEAKVIKIPKTVRYDIRDKLIKAINAKG